METIRELDEFPPPARGSVVTVGNFDGVHVAHQQLLRRVTECAKARRALSAAVTFDPHPVRVLAPQRALKVLTSLAEKVRLIEEQGIDLLVILPFTRELAHLSPQEFVHRILVTRLRAMKTIVGPNFRFGYRQAGDIQTLAELSAIEGFEVEVVPAVKLRGQPVSSSRVRELVAAGKVYAAGRLLGRPFFNSGPIVAGLGVGRRQTVPTLNLAPVEEQLPQSGVYITRTRLAGVWHDSVTNVGHKPTFGEHRLTVESYLLSFAGDARQNEMAVEYLHRLRDEIKFQNPALLKIQIQEDARRSVKFFRLLKQLRRKDPAKT
jgi:riboflavin kinase / FMN adenylyltransferase